MGPVRVGNQAYRQVQNDVYGSAVLAATHVVLRPPACARSATRRCSAGSSRSASARSRCTTQPDAGLWELRGTARVHTFSSVMCWAACDRLAKIAARLGLAERAPLLARARRPRSTPSICARAWNARARQLRRHLRRRRARREPAAAGRAGLPARRRSALRRHRRRGRARAASAATSSSATPSPTTSARRRTRSSSAPSGTSTRSPRSAAATRRARCSRRLLARRNRLGLLAEHIDPATGELWGNFPQTYSMVGMINSATRLSIPWDQAF